MTDRVPERRGAAAECEVDRPEEVAAAAPCCHKPPSVGDEPFAQFRDIVEGGEAGGDSGRDCEGNEPSS
jgi:hypothetical protein